MKTAGLAAIAATLALAGCGGGGAHEDLAACLDKTEARAATAESVLEGSVGAVDMLDPSAVIHVFETEEAAAPHANDEEVLGEEVQIGKVVVYDDDPKVLELVRGCV